MGLQMTSQISYSDSHAHLTSSDILQHVDEVLARAQQAGVKAIINIATGSESLKEGLLLKKRYPWIYNSAAVHPHDVQDEGDRFFSIIEKNAQEGNMIAIGETGLDYHYKHSPEKIQKEYFVKHLKLALKYHLPVIIHCREAFKDFFHILDNEFVHNGRHMPGVLHCFTGTIKDAVEVIERGWYLSLSGIVTFRKSEELREVARLVPLNQLLIETDAPYLAPHSKRGHPNEPSYVVETAQCIASARGIPLEDLAHATYNNMLQLFKLH